MKKYAYILFLLMATMLSCSRFSEDVARKLIMVDILLKQNLPDSALRTLQDISHPEELGTEQYARYCLSCVRVQDRARKPLTSDSLINVAVRFFGRNPDRFPPEAMRASYLQARVYEETGRGEEAMELYLSLEPRMEVLKEYNLLGLLNSRVGRLFRMQNRVEQSIGCDKKAAKYFKLADSRQREGYALSMLGYNYLYLKQYDSAMVYLQEAKQIAGQINDTLLLSESLIYLGIANDFTGNTPAVKLYLSEAAVYEKSDRKLMEVYNYLAGAYFKDHQYETARLYANRALALSEKLPVAYKIYGLCTSVWHLYNIERAEGKLRMALDYYYKYSDAKDSIAVLENRNNVLEVQEKYKAEELKAENMRLLAERESGRLAQTLGIFSVVGAVLILLIIRWLHRLSVLKRKEQELTKEARLKDFLLKRLDVSKELVTLAQYPASDSQRLQQKLKQLVESQSFNLSDQKELIDTVNELFDNFAVKLTERYPQLTGDELQLCCMVRCGFEAGLMATAMGMNLDSIYKKRWRLRRKFNLEHDEDFELFLRKLV